MLDSHESLAKRETSHLSRGSFKKTWLTLRRVLAVAELMGLPRTSRGVEFPSSSPVTLTADDNQRMIKAELWESICVIDRIAGMVFSLPVGTRRYPRQKQPVIVNGEVSNRFYLFQLADIAMKVQDLDDGVSGSANRSLYAEALEMDRELQSLASLTPRQWWDDQDQSMSIKHILQYWHHYVTMRIHLPFVLQNNRTDFIYSHNACVGACQALLCRYPTLRLLLPPGFLANRLVDLQAFTAAIVLLLTRNRSREQDHQLSEPIIARVITCMDSVSGQMGSDFARQGVVAIRSLKTFLNGSQSTDLILKVPLVGKIRIRRNVGQRSMDAEPSNVHNQISDTLPTSDTDSWDPLSWVIENDWDSSLQDMLMDDYLD